MTRRPFIVVCPKTGWADIRTHKDEVYGSYYLGYFSNEWRLYHDEHRGVYPFPSADSASKALKSAPPVPADAVWGPEEDEPKASPDCAPPTLDDELARLRKEVDSLSAILQGKDDAIAELEHNLANVTTGQTIIASLSDIRIRLENGTIDELPSTIVVNVGDGRTVRYTKETK